MATPPRRRTFNPKRRLKSVDDRTDLKELADRITYGGNPAHKRHPGDFDLMPPAQARPDKTLCDGVGIDRKDQALALLREGVLKGLISERQTGVYPQNIWSVTDKGAPLEAQLDNQETGSYHGYPMPATDPFRDQVLAAWRRAENHG